MPYVAFISEILLSHWFRFLLLYYHMKKLLSNVEDPFQIIFPRSGCEKSICKQLVFQFCFSLQSISCPMSHVNAFGFGRNMTFGGLWIWFVEFFFWGQCEDVVREKKRSLQSPSVPYKECGGLVHLLNLFLCTLFSGVLSTWGTSMHNYMLVVHTMVFCFC